MVVATFWGVVEVKMASEVLASARDRRPPRGRRDCRRESLPGPPAIGGVRLLVAPGDVENAMELLELRALIPGGEPPPVDFRLARGRSDARRAAADESVGKFLEGQKKQR